MGFEDSERFVDVREGEVVRESDLNVVEEERQSLERS